MNMRSVFLPVSLTLLLSAYAMAEELDVPPPPENGAADVIAALAEPDVKESAPNLNEELGAPDSSVAVDVRSYQRSDGATITEYAVRGRVYKIKVQPAGGLPAYYLYDPEGEGHFQRYSHGGGKPLSVPNWVLQEF